MKQNNNDLGMGIIIGLLYGFGGMMFILSRYENPYLIIFFIVLFVVAFLIHQGELNKENETIRKL